METKKDIYSFWIHYTTKNEEIYFRKFISGLVSIWEDQLKLNWDNDDMLPDSTTIAPDFGPHLSRLPEELLPAIGKFLYVTKDRIDKDEITVDELHDTELLIRTLIIICRNFSNISSVATADYVRLIVSIASAIMLKIIKSQHENQSNTNDYVSFCVYCCHFLESLYDPLFTWRFFKRTRSLPRDIQILKRKQSIAILHIEVVPFIFEFFESNINGVAPSLAVELLNVLGGIVNGSPRNALISICPATVKILVAVITTNLIAKEIRYTAVQCFIIMMQNLLPIEAHQRQIEISTLLESYRRCISEISSTSVIEFRDEEKISSLCTMFDMLSTLLDVSDEKFVKIVRCAMAQNFILDTLLDAVEKIEICNVLIRSCFATIANIIKEEDIAKERLVKINGYDRMFRKLKLVDNADVSLLIIFVEMVIERKYQNASCYQLRNAKPIVPLIQLIPFLEHEKQEWLSSIVYSICSCNLLCKWKAIKCGAIKTTCETLTKYKVLTNETVDQLINLIEILASVSVGTVELKLVFGLFLINDNELCPFYMKLLRALSNITRRNNLVNCTSYFDLQSNDDGISVPEIKKWPGSLFGFTFHCWLCLNEMNIEDSAVRIEGDATAFRRQIITLMTPAKQGIEININNENNLLIIVNTKKEFLTVTLFDFVFEENRWYCLDVCYVPSKRPFSQNQICIYIDGIQQLVATAKFAHITEPFTWCRIGSPINDPSFEDETAIRSNQNTCEVEKTGLLPSFISHVPSFITFPLRTSSNLNPYVKNFPLGMQNTILGPPFTLEGQLGNVCLFQEPINSAHIRLLYEIGINGDIFSNADEHSEFATLQSKLVFFYSPLACAFDKALDLCSKYKLDGRTTAVVCKIRSLEESVNSIGGPNIFLPFFETCDYSSPEKETARIRDDSIGHFCNDLTESTDLTDFTDFTVFNRRHISEIQLEENPIAAVITIIKNLLKNSTSREYFFKRHGFAMLGHLLSTVSTNLVDTSVLVAVCLISENVINMKNYLYQRTFYQNVLFNFDIWYRCDFQVQQGHVQFLNFFIKKDKKFFKKRFGVQFFLDIVRKYFCYDDTTKTNAVKPIRVSIIAIVNYYIQKEVNVQEITAIVNYIVSSVHDYQVIEMVEMLINHLHNKSCTDQLYLLLYEQRNADSFYALLTNTTFSVELKKSIFRLFLVLLRTDRVYERSKLRLQLQDQVNNIGMYPGFVMSLPTDNNALVHLSTTILDQVFLIESNGGYAAALILLSRLANAPLCIKLEAARKILIVVYMRSNAASLLAKQIGWQESICALLVRYAITNSTLSTNDTLENRLEVSSNYEYDNKHDVHVHELLRDNSTAPVAAKQSDNRQQSTLEVGAAAAAAAAVTSPRSLVSDNLQAVASSISSVADDVSSLVAENILYATNNITSAAENVSVMVNENIQMAANTVTSVAENVNTLVTDNINLAAEFVGSACSLIAQKANFDKYDHVGAQGELNSKSSGLLVPSNENNYESFVSLNFDDLSLSNRSYSNGSIDNISLGNRSQSSQSKCSPSHASKDTISVNSIRSESNESDGAAFDDNLLVDVDDDERVIFDVTGPWNVTENTENNENQEDKEQELCNAVVNILFTIMWKGYDIHDKSIWKERGQVMACINMIGLNNALYGSHNELKMKLLEMMLQSAVLELQDGQSGENFTIRFENYSHLLRWVYDFLIVDFNNRNKSSKTVSVKFLDNVIALVDLIMVFRENPSEELPELVKISLSLLLKHISYADTEICAIAAAKLHTVIQTRKMADIHEGCYILYLLNAIVTDDLKTRNMEHYSFVVPVMKTLLIKLTDTFEKTLLDTNNIDINIDSGAEFYEKFQKLNNDEHWVAFIETKVKQYYEKYENLLNNDLFESMNVFWAECYEAYKIGLQKREKLIEESVQKYREMVHKTFDQRKAEEYVRYGNIISHYRNHKLSLKKKWKIQKNYLIGVRRAWKDCPRDEHWRLSHHENFSRMRLKLIPNLYFNDHKDASNLRDNAGWTKMRLSEELQIPAVPLNISQAALRKQSDCGAAAAAAADQQFEIDLVVEKLMENEIENKLEMATGGEKLLLNCDCQLVTLMSVIKGKIEITIDHVYFYDLSQIKEDNDRNDFKWSITKLRELYLRRYNLCKTALEFFLTDQTNYFLNFTKEARNNVFTTLIRLRPANLLYHSHKSPADLLKWSDLVQKWVNREISNFDYLMQLNTIAGRTYNDLSQYPIFPWILADYESDELDLTNPATFRDLSKPIGVVNSDNEQEVRNKYDTFEDPCGIIAKFHYGTHYSNSAGVLHYLVRVEPFTTLHIDLQSGRFDVADRQFHSIPQTWKLLMENPNDVKELIPEFFYFPEFLKNINKFDLGILQGTKDKVDDVILPKWASTPEDFIYKHRKALESEYVSSHLHEWIDLIFGYKQRGPEAIKALNVFYYCSYEGAVDLDAIENATEREAVEGMINNFGQTPSQLLKDPHPARLSLDKALQRILEYTHTSSNIRKPDLTLFFDQLTHFQIEMSSDRDPVVFLNPPRCAQKSFLTSSGPDVLISVSRNGLLGMHSWSPHDKHSTKGFSIVVDESVNNIKWRRDLSGSFHPSIKLHSKLFVVSYDYKALFTAGHWDSSIKIYSFAKNRYVHSLIKHTDIVTCVAVDSCGWYLISGSKDCTCIVWDVSQPYTQLPKPYQLLHGHDKPISCVSIATELDMAVSGSQDGTINVYTIHEGHLVHTLSPEGCVSPIADVTHVTVSVQGHIAFSLSDKINHSVHIYSVNGVNLGSKYILGRVTGLSIVNDCVVVTDDAGDLTISRLLGLHPMYNVPLHIPIQTVVATSGSTHLLVPLRDGNLVVVGLPT